MISYYIHNSSHSREVDCTGCIHQGAGILGDILEFCLSHSDPYVKIPVSHIKWYLDSSSHLDCFYFELIVDSRSCKTFTERLYISTLILNFQSKNWKFSPMVTSYINIVHYQNQEIDISILWLSRLHTLLQFHQFCIINFKILVCLCV